MLTALAFLHEKSVIHQDVRPGNILVHPWPIHVSLSDFSHCTISGDAFVGRPWSEQAAAHVTYTAPELLMGCRCIDESVDMWSCGLVMLRLYMEAPIMNETTSRGVVRVLLKMLGNPSSGVGGGIAPCCCWRGMYGCVEDEDALLLLCLSALSSR